MPTTVHADRSALAVRLAPLDRLLALRGDVVVPAHQIASIAAIADGLAAVRGLRAPGLGVPGSRKIGTWRRRGDVTVAVVRGRGPALEITTTGGAVNRIIVSAPDARERVAALRAALEAARP